MEGIQECVKHVNAYKGKQLTFLIISQSPQDDDSSGQTDTIFTEVIQIEMPGPSSAAPCVERRHDDRCAQTESIFTEDLQINWSVVTAQRLEQISQELRR